MECGGSSLRTWPKQPHRVCIKKDCGNMYFYEGNCVKCHPLQNPSGTWLIVCSTRAHLIWLQRYVSQMFGCIVPISLLVSTKNSNMQHEKHGIIEHFQNPDVEIRVVVIVEVNWYEVKASEGQQWALKYQLAEGKVSSSICISIVPTTKQMMNNTLSLEESTRLFWVRFTENINTDFCSETIWSSTDVCRRS